MTWKLIFGCYDSFFRRVCFLLFINEFSNSHTGTFQSVNLPIDIRLLHKCLPINGVCFSLIGFKVTCSAVQDLYLIHWCNTDSIQILSLNVIILPKHTVCFITETFVHTIGATWLFSHGWPSDLFHRCTWNPHGCLSPIVNSILLHVHFSMSNIYIWLIGATKTLSYGWIVYLIRYCNTYSSQSQNPTTTLLLLNVPSLMSEYYTWFFSAAPTFWKKMSWNSSFSTIQMFLIILA